MKQWLGGYAGFILGVLAMGALAYWYWVKVLGEETESEQ